MQESGRVHVLAARTRHLDRHDRVREDDRDSREGREERRLHQIRAAHEQQDDEEQPVGGSRAQGNQVDGKGFERA